MSHGSIYIILTEAIHLAVGRYFAKKKMTANRYVSKQVQTEK